MIAHKLKEDTLAAHQALEGLLIRRMKAIKNKEDYAGLLAMFYGYSKPVEEQIAKYITSVELPDIAHRRKAGWLTEDIGYLGGTSQEPAMATSLPHITNRAQAMGALYVMEGSTLGGQHILKMIGNSLGIEGMDGFHFFNSYGSETGAYWKRFTEAINHFSDTEGQEDAIVAAANDTFTRFREWAAVQGNTPL